MSYRAARTPRKGHSTRNAFTVLRRWAISVRSSLGRLCRTAQPAPQRFWFLLTSNMTKNILLLIINRKTRSNARTVFRGAEQD